MKTIKIDNEEFKYDHFFESETSIHYFRVDDNGTVIDQRVIKKELAI